LGNEGEERREEKSGRGEVAVDEVELEDKGEEERKRDSERLVN